MGDGGEQWRLLPWGFVGGGTAKVADSALINRLPIQDVNRARVPATSISFFCRCYTAQRRAWQAAWPALATFAGAWGDDVAGLGGRVEICSAGPYHVMSTFCDYTGACPALERQRHEGSR